jgi:hypothetical protein
MNKQDIITSELTADILVPMAKQCIAKIKKLRAEKSLKYLEGYAERYNAKWYNRLLKRTLKGTDEVIAHFDADKTMFPEWSWRWPCIDNYETENQAEAIIEYFDGKTGGNPTYTIPIEIYNNIAYFCRD